MYVNEQNLVDEEKAKSMRVISNEIEKAFGEFYKPKPENIVEICIAASIDRLTDKVSELIELLKKQND